MSDWSVIPANNATKPGINMATGAAPSTVHPGIRQIMADLANARTTISVKDYGAVGDGSTDDTVAIQAAINAAAALYPANVWFATNAMTSPRIVSFVTARYKISGSLLLPSGIILDGNNSLLIGTGNLVGANIGIQSAYFNTGVITSNLGTTAETQRVQFSGIRGFKFTQFAAAISVYDFNEGCYVRDCGFFDCWQDLIADRCFYAEFTNLHNREPQFVSLATSSLAAFDFRNFVNAEGIRGISVTNRILGMQFTGGVNGQALTAITVESGTNGIKFTGNDYPLAIEGCYFEGLTGTALDTTGAGSAFVGTIDNNWFNNVATCLSALRMQSGRFGAGNYFTGTIGTKITCTDNASYATIEIPPIILSSTATTLIPAALNGYSLGQSLRVIAPLNLYDNTSGSTLVKSLAAVDQFVDLPYFGVSGYVPGKIAFCAATSSGGTTFNIIIDTRITWSPYVAGMFALTLTDNISTYIVNGRFVGGTTYLDTASGKTITATNNGGYARLTLSSFSHPSGTFSAEGIVRLI